MAVNGFKVHRGTIAQGAVEPLGVIKGFDVIEDGGVGLRPAAGWRWARRRHPKKSRDWVKKHCLPALGKRAWTFACKTAKQTPEGKPVWLRLVYAGETEIRRDVKIRGDANPFDPQWQDCLKERAFQNKFGITRRQAGIKPL